MMPVVILNLVQWVDGLYLNVQWNTRKVDVHFSQLSELCDGWVVAGGGQGCITLADRGFLTFLHPTAYQLRRALLLRWILPCIQQLHHFKTSFVPRFYPF